MPEITFISKGTSFKLRESKRTSDWLISIARKEKRRIQSLSYVFATDKLVGALNQEYLKHKTLTDIITFDYSSPAEINAEVFISIPRVRENARAYNQTFSNELRRVMAHGLLHVLGYKDKTVRDSAQMRRKEEACLSLWD
jgi:probable rRNA maturation factor